MKHRARARKLGRTTSHRLAMLRNMVTSLLEHERIRTTDAKAKEVRRVADRMITLGKRGDLHARRRALRTIRRREVAAKVFDELAERYRDRPGGYTRLIKLRPRVGDAAPLSLVELMPESAPAEKPAKKSRKRAGAAATPSKKATAKEGRKAPARKKAPRKKTAAGAAKATARKPPTKKPGAKKSSRRKSD